MKRIRRIYLLPLALLVIFGIIIGGYYVYMKRVKAFIVIDSSPGAQVFINNEKQGKTPYESELDSGEITLKLVPESVDIPLIPYEAKVKLVSGVTTIVRREFGEEEEGDAGELISFEKLNGSDAAISVIVKPDGAKVFVDNEFVDLAPAKTTMVSPGEHEILVSAEKYFERRFKVQVVEGYGITAIVELAKNAEAFSVQEEIIEDENKEIEEKIVIDETPTGFLRVRNEPSVGSEEVFQVKPGDEFEIIEIDEESGWYKILYDEENEGWVTKEYASIKDEDVNDE